jgi:hypothetical protein
MLSKQNPETAPADRLLGVEFDQGRLGFRLVLQLRKRLAEPLPRRQLRQLPRLVCASFRRMMWVIRPFGHCFRKMFEARGGNQSIVYRQL